MFRVSLFAAAMLLAHQVGHTHAQVDGPVVNLVTNHDESALPTVTVPEPIEIAPPVAGIGIPTGHQPPSVHPMPMGFGPLDPGEYELVPSQKEGVYIARPKYDMPTVKFTLDAFVFSRSGGVQDEPLLLTAPFPATTPGLSSNALAFEKEFGGRAEILFYGNAQEIAPRASVIWTGYETAKGSVTGANGGQADINFFQAVAAEPADGYNARNESEFIYADIGLRKTISPAYGISFSLAAGQIAEDLNLTEQEDSTQGGGGGGGGGGGSQNPGQVGFYSQVDNKFYGVELGMDGHLWENQYFKLDGRATAGIFYNDMKVAAQALNVQQKWDPAGTAFVSTLNLSLVLPADPFNFRVGYQGVYLDGIALPVLQSRDRSLFTNAGDDPTEAVWYHGILIGIEILH